MGELKLLELGLLPGTENRSSAEQPFGIALAFEVAFELDLCLDFVHVERGTCLARRQYRADGRDASWLPRGRYRFEAWAPRLALPPGTYRIEVGLFHNVRGRPEAAATRTLACTVAHGEGDGPALAWDLVALPGSTP